MRAENSVWAEVYALYYDRVFGYVLNRVRSRPDAEDVASEVFLKLYSLAGFDPRRRGAASYVFRAMQTTLADYYRERGSLCVVPEETDGLSGGEDLDDTLVELDRALDTLAEREREIVILHYYNGLSHREIAEKMRLSYANVRQLCHVALRKLRSAMRETDVPAR